METEMWANNPGAIAAARMAYNRYDEPDAAGDDPVREDHYAHAAGAICEKCDRAIEATQVARRHGERYARPAATAGLLGLREQSVQVARAATTAGSCITRTFS